MRDLLVIVADKDTRQALLGLFERADWHAALGCRRIQISERDIVEPAGQKDPGLFKRADELARPYLRTHQHLLVLLDCAWAGAPGRPEIENGIAERLKRNGWNAAAFEVIAIDPEVEIWLWSDTDALGEAFATEIDAKSGSSLGDTIAELSERVADDPKRRLANLRDRLRIPASSAQFRRFASRARLDRCRDPAFARLRRALVRWFPP